jgi:hypothetical protein
MGAISALVAEVSVDLEHALETAGDGPLEEQLGRDPQVQVDVEGIGVRDERTSRGATVQGLQHGSLDLQKSTPRHALADRGNHRDTGAGHVLRLRPRDQVDVALAHPRLLVERLVRDGQRAQCLRRHPPLVGHDGQLTALAGDHLTADEDVVSDVDEVLPRVQLFLADLGQREHRLEFRAVPRAQRREAQLPGVAQEDHATGERRLRTRRHVGLQVRVGRANLGDRGRDRQPDRVRLHAASGKGAALLAPDPHLLGEVVLHLVRGRAALHWAGHDEKAIRWPLRCRHER